jgi:hypothetical protein
MKRIIAIIILVFVGQALPAQPLVTIGISRNVVIDYMDNQPGCTRISPDKQKTEATYLIPGLAPQPDTITYHFVRNTLGMGYTCTQVTVKPVDVAALIAEKLKTYRFVVEPYGYSLYTGYVNDNVVKVFRVGNTLVMKY